METDDTNTLLSLINSNINVIDDFTGVSNSQCSSVV